MKKLLSIVTALVLCAALMLPLTVSAAPNASATFTGPDTVRAGDTITLTFALNGTGLLGMEGSLSYDSSQVTLTGITQKVASPWLVEQNGNRIVAYDNQQTAPINKSTALFTATFKVNSSLSAGAKVSISVNNCIASDGTDAALGTIAYSATIAPPMSSDNTLKSLTVSNATLSVAFDPNTVSYSTTVPFSVSKLDVKAEANDSKAQVSVSSPSLTVGSNNAVTVTVTAENGTKKTYTIKVTRQQDPNYVASGENNLAALTVDGFLLSPVFSADKTEYVVWLPYETEQVSAGGTPKDSKASVRVEGGEKLLAGQDNEIKVICVAENGSEKVYTIIAKRAAAHDGSVDIPNTSDTPDIDDPNEGDDQTVVTPPVSHKGCISFWWLIPVFLLGAALGIGGAVYYYEKIKKHNDLG